MYVFIIFICVIVFYKERNYLTLGILDTYSTRRRRKKEDRGMTWIVSRIRCKLGMYGTIMQVD
jgi:hypothetical protein